MYYHASFTAEDKLYVSIGIEKSQVLAPVTFIFGPITFIYEFDTYPLKMHLQTKNELASPRHPKVIVLQIYRHMTPITYTTPFCKWKK